MNGADIAPMVTWGNSPEDAISIAETIPNPDDANNADHAQAMRAALDYMDLKPGMSLNDVAVDKVFIGACTNSRIEDLRLPGCSMCVGMNGDLLKAGERSASTSNRNFRGRQGLDSRTHLVSPAMAAAAAVSGRFVDVRELVEEL